MLPFRMLVGRRPKLTFNRIFGTWNDDMFADIG